MRRPAKHPGRPSTKVRRTGEAGAKGGHVPIRVDDICVIFDSRYLLFL
ncbi:hypothetical protein DVUA0144 (plasmid) [Nitratidesulfovibrio vulgaris str. Hildenborough]|uniref:Uncharacterized protein n=1 Tax=Nitratidesulfovibrio vulgaris (strain ATCC 29579 / DSM 644 / CCUG 34227 / NCIMB 8303 / VKM B-1760 / Hildenborough) TaxID=882 RepID=Q72WE5_NITV2|nr:hypothetical protein DVUA0144 [Nitratidesulfovibrio vulgaris str. Hildenborough]